jgi:putative flippase GtrA
MPSKHAHKSGSSHLSGTGARFVLAALPTYAVAVTPLEPARPGLFARLYQGVRDQVGHLVHEIAKFGVVGLVALIVDVTVFNFLLYHSSGLLHGKPTTAKIVSTTIATVVSYIGNRFWTFRHRDRVGNAREYLLFFLLNGVGLAIAAGCVAFSNYVLGLTSPLANNIAANVVGLGLGTMFRFWAYRRWVFPEYAEDDELTRELRQPV